LIFDFASCLIIDYTGQTGFIYEAYFIYIIAPLCISVKKTVDNLSMIALIKHFENTLGELDDMN